MKTVSFVIPVYNPPEDRFRALLDSVLAQDGVGIEVVAVNDGSTNNALGILREYEAAHPGKMVVIDQKNAGEGPSRNEGFRRATGDYVWFVDADDLVRPGAAAFLVDAIEKADAEQIFFQMVSCSPDETKPFPEQWTGVPYKTTALAEIARHRFSPCCGLSRRSFLERVGVRYSNAKTGEDAAESLRWELEARSLARVDEICYKYYILPNSISHAMPSAKHFVLGWQVMDLFNALRERHPDYARWLDLWNYTRARGHLALARKFLAETDRHSPEEMEAVRAARDEYQRRFDALDADNPLIALYDIGRRLGRDNVRYRISEIEADAKALRDENAELEGEIKALCAKAESLCEERATIARETTAMKHSLSWRFTAPLRAVAGLFAGTRKRG